MKKTLKNNYKLDLLSKVRIYLIFYVSLLENVIDINITKTKRNNVEIEINVYKIKTILNIRIQNGRIKYKAK